MPFFIALLVQVFFLTLKLTEAVAWAWWIIFTPLITWVVWVLIVAAIIFMTVWSITNKRKAWR